MKRSKFAIAAIFDTETCNLGNDSKTARAIPILYIDNDIRDVDLLNYKEDRDDTVTFYRYEEEYFEKLLEYIRWGEVAGVVPVVCAYNLMFDLQSLLQRIDSEFVIEANAQSSTNVYTLDLKRRQDGSGEASDSPVLLRFWDTFHLDMRGLAKMGEVAGLPKAMGSWDYGLVRTPKTELTPNELHYAARDTQVIPMFLRFLLRTNDWMQQSDLGCKVLTKTSLVRQMARHQIGRIKIEKDDGKKITVEKMFLELCKKEMPRTFNQYALRKACFKGGYTFTAARFASTIQHNIISVDVTSMHHLFLNGRYIPENFKYMSTRALDRMCNRILATSRDDVIRRYHKPFDFAVHVRVRLTNIRLRRNTPFESWGIGLAPMSKFKRTRDASECESRYEGENALIENGWHDSFRNGEFAFGKLYKADEVTMHLNEIELWCMGRVYEWDSLEVLYGEGTMSFCKPPDYVTLQSNVLYTMKDDCKFITNHYREGEPYPFRIPDTIPESYARELSDGTLAWEDFNAYYISDTKGKFNGIYGTMAQDVYKPSYTCRNGMLEVDRRTVVTRESWDRLKMDSSKVLYTYGMRIVGGSRMHMILAIERVFESFGDAARVLGGDTDSMKISLDDYVTDKMVAESLQLFQDVSKQAIDETMKRVRRLYPKMASTLKGIGGFEIENEGHHYTDHIELWNKCRCSIDGDEHVHITCAGLSRPKDEYHIERFIEDLVAAGHKAGDVLKMCVGYNVFVPHNVCHALEGHRPNVQDRVQEEVTDYLGVTSAVDTHEVVCLYPSGRWLGETMKQSNRQNIEYVRNHYGREIDTSIKRLFVEDGIAEVCIEHGSELESVMIGGART